MRKLFFLILALTLLYYTARGMLKFSGIHYSGFNVILLVILFIFLNSSKKAFWFIGFPISLAYSIYAPIGSLFGRITYRSVASLLATDAVESKEFFKLIPLENYTYPVLLIGALLLSRFILCKNKIYLHKNKTLIIIFIIIAMIKQSPFAFFNDIYSASSNVKKELSFLRSMDKHNSWSDYAEKVSNLSKYTNYVLVIGESARKDYLNAYGYPVNNTPFMSSSNGVLVDGLMAGGISTVESLRLMLTKPNVDLWEPNYKLNVIDLARSAGFKTYWVSNQGFGGDYETPVTTIARRADIKKFFKIGSAASINTSDFELLPEFEKIVKNNTEKKLIVLHLYGSHVNACERIKDFEKKFTVKNPLYKYFGCYVTSIAKTDMFLEKVYKILKNEEIKNNKTFSMIYFSNHGQSHSIDKGKYVLMHLNNSGQPTVSNYNIPLFKVSSYDNKQIKCKSFKSGLNFTNGIGTWLGIKNKLIDPNYDLFDCKNDSNDYGLSEKLKLLPKDMQTIDISDK